MRKGGAPADPLQLEPLNGLHPFQSQKAFLKEQDIFFPGALFHKAALSKAQQLLPGSLVLLVPPDMHDSAPALFLSLSHRLIPRRGSFGLGPTDTREELLRPRTPFPPPESPRLPAQHSPPPPASRRRASRNHSNQGAVSGEAAFEKRTSEDGGARGSGWAVGGFQETGPPSSPCPTYATEGS